MQSFQASRPSSIHEIFQTTPVDSSNAGEGEEYLDEDDGWEDEEDDPDEYQVDECEDNNDDINND
ncbi:hypothetical protein VNI00_016861 [Paramarasmius palmivorus]|uniref:Uncharacterized protein n=1 Tax=Paramarasmius palmivorus TaxID=297713 RepID=A0AAW0BAT7_9AGAR